MSIEVVCPGGHPLRVKREALGHHVTCPRCGQRFRVPPTGAALAEVGRSGLPAAGVLSLPAEAIAGLPRAVRLTLPSAAGRASRPPEPARPAQNAIAPAAGGASIAAAPGGGSPIFRAAPPHFETGHFETARPDNPPSEASLTMPTDGFPSGAARPVRTRAARQAAGRRVREILAALVILSVVAAVAAAAWWILDRRGFFKNLSKGRPATVGLR